MDLSSSVAAPVPTQAIHGLIHSIDGLALK